MNFLLVHPCDAVLIHRQDDSTVDVRARMQSLVVGYDSICKNTFEVFLYSLRQREFLVS